MGTGRCFDCAPVPNPLSLTDDGVGRRHIDTARYYQNEDQVGQAVRQSGIPREEVFVSKFIPLRVVLAALPDKCAYFNAATKVYNQEQGYESTLRAVDDSLKNFGYGEY